MTAGRSADRAGDRSCTLSGPVLRRSWPPADCSVATRAAPNAMAAASAIIDPARSPVITHLLLTDTASEA